MLVIKKETITHGNITFIIREDRLYIQTPLQSFLLEPTEYYHRKRLQRISLQVEMGHIRSYADLFEQTGDVIRMIPVRSAWIR